ncbi:MULTISPECIES: type II toxin-antitoxin system RelB/DinJ family antitoxin [unclassified Anaerococcus]|uniref:type II toxin-antitoxin system RelB/DinJ family antitoxin n=1 Tax=unclassified Anaerococcus TaxID=2614126 RepID=UPI000C084BF1|nr:MULTISPECIES: type II toxin-antitoxin system RelB/DinJ family antitoxin [unclassified Anaerococcus]
MTNTKLNINIDKNLKDQAQKVLDSLEIDMSTAIRMYLAQVVRDREIPFTPSLNNPNEQARFEAENNDTIKFKDLEELKSYIEKL